jgi:hypothetical protein
MPISDCPQPLAPNSAPQLRGLNSAEMRSATRRAVSSHSDAGTSANARPKINVASDLIAAAAAVTEAAASGDITPGEAASLSTLVGNVAKAVETVELAERLAKLEEQMTEKGGNP